MGGDSSGGTQLKAPNLLASEPPTCGEAEGGKRSAAGFGGGLGLSVAHGIWMTEKEMDAVAENGVAVSHNPSSNLRLRAGIAPVLQFRERGVPVGIGMDGFAINDDEDMFSELRLAWRLNGTPPLLEISPKRQKKEA